MEALTDTSKMPFGKYQGKAMIEVPAEYLLWLYDQNPKSGSLVTTYIKDNLDVLKSQVKKK